jgi:intracellular multiplication protein IcmD
MLSLFRFLVFLFLSLGLTMVHAQSAHSLGSIAQNITNTFDALTRLITATAYVTGAGLFFIAVFQFRQHKENPTQVPLSKPMMFLALGCALLFFPTFIQMTEHTIFGDNAITAGPHGVLVGV